MPTTLFNDLGILMKRAEWLEELLHVPASASNSLPAVHVRQRYRNVEKQLSSLRQMAHASYKLYSLR